MSPVFCTLETMAAIKLFTLSILLIMAGDVETNPGPIRVCVPSERPNEVSWLDENSTLDEIQRCARGIREEHWKPIGNKMGYDDFKLNQFRRKFPRLQDAFLQLFGHWRKNPKCNEAELGFRPNLNQTKVTMTFSRKPVNLDQARRAELEADIKKEVDKKTGFKAMSLDVKQSYQACKCGRLRAECSSNDVVRVWNGYLRDSRKVHETNMRIVVFAPLLYNRSTLAPKWQSWMKGLDLIVDDSAPEEKKKEVFARLDDLEKIFEFTITQLSTVQAQDFQQLSSLLEEIEAYSDFQSVIKVSRQNTFFNRMYESLKKKCKIAENKLGRLLMLMTFKQYWLYVHHTVVHKKEILAHLMKLSDKDEKAMNDLKDKGNALFKKNQFKEAQKSYTEALSIGVFNHILYSNRCQTFLRMEEYWNALWDARRAVTIKPGLQKGHYRYAQAFFEVKDIERAIRENKKGQKLCRNASTPITELEKQYQAFQAERSKELRAKKEAELPDLVEASTDSDGSLDSDHEGRRARSTDINRDLEKDRQDWERLQRRQRKEEIKELKEQRFLFEQGYHKAYQQQKEEHEKMAAWQKMKEDQARRQEAAKREERRQQKKKAEEEAKQNKLKAEEQRKMKEEEKKQRKKEKKEEKERMRREREEQERRFREEEMMRERIQREMARKREEQTEVERCLEEGSTALIGDKPRPAIAIYEKAASLMKDTGKELGGLREQDYIIFLYAHAMAYMKSGIPTEVNEAATRFQAITDEFPSLRNALPYYGLALALYKLNRFEAALDPLEKAEFMATHFDMPNQIWPGTYTVIPETEKGKLQEAISELRHWCKVPPNPDAVCKYDPCTMKREMYLSDVDFKGYIKTLCSDRCHLDYHIGCWKSRKSELGKNIDKDALNTQCSTPDCVGTLACITVIGANGLVKTESKVEREKPTKSAKEESKPKTHAQPHAKRKDKGKKKKKEHSTSEGAAAKSEKGQGDGNEHTDKGATAPKAEASHQHVQKPRSYSDAGSKEEEKQVGGKDGVKEELKDEIEMEIEMNPDAVYVLKRDEFEEEENVTKKKTKSKKRTKKIQQMAPLDVLDIEFDESRPHTRYGADYDGEDYGESRPWHSTLATSSERPFALPEHLQQAARELNLEPPPKREPVRAVAETDEKKSQKMVLYLTFSDVLAQHGPLKVDDPLLTESLLFLDLEHQELVHDCGGLKAFLSSAPEDIVVVGDYASLTKDIKRCSELAYPEGHSYSDLSESGASASALLPRADSQNTSLSVVSAIGTSDSSTSAMTVSSGIMATSGNNRGALGASSSGQLNQNTLLPRLNAMLDPTVPEFVPKGISGVSGASEFVPTGMVKSGGLPYNGPAILSSGLSRPYGLLNYVSGVNPNLVAGKDNVGTDNLRQGYPQQRHRIVLNDDLDDFSDDFSDSDEEDDESDDDEIESAESKNAGFNVEDLADSSSEDEDDDDEEFFDTHDGSSLQNPSSDGIKTELYQSSSDPLDVSKADGIDDEDYHWEDHFDASKDDLENEDDDADDEDDNEDGEEISEHDSCDQFEEGRSIASSVESSDVLDGTSKTDPLDSQSKNDFVHSEQEKSDKTEMPTHTGTSPDSDSVVLGKDNDSENSQGFEERAEKGFVASSPKDCNNLPLTHDNKADTKIDSNDTLPKTDQISTDILTEENLPKSSSDLAQVSADIPGNSNSSTNNENVQTEAIVKNEKDSLQDLNKPELKSDQELSRNASSNEAEEPVKMSSHSNKYFGLNNNEMSEADSGASGQKDDDRQTSVSIENSTSEPVSDDGSPVDGPLVTAAESSGGGESVAGSSGSKSDPESTSSGQQPVGEVSEIDQKSSSDVFIFGRDAGVSEDQKLFGGDLAKQKGSDLSDQSSSQLKVFDIKSDLPGKDQETQIKDSESTNEQNSVVENLPAGNIGEEKIDSKNTDQGYNQNGIATDHTLEQKKLDTENNEKTSSTQDSITNPTPSNQIGDAGKSVAKHDSSLELAPTEKMTFMDADIPTLIPSNILHHVRDDQTPTGASELDRIAKKLNVDAVLFVPPDKKSGNKKPNYTLTLLDLEGGDGTNRTAKQYAIGANDTMYLEKSYGDVNESSSQSRKGEKKKSKEREQKSYNNEPEKTSSPKKSKRKSKKQSDTSDDTSGKEIEDAQPVELKKAGESGKEVEQTGASEKNWRDEYERKLQEWKQQQPAYPVTREIGVNTKAEAWKLEAEVDSLSEKVKKLEKDWAKEREKVEKTKAHYSGELLKQTKKSNKLEERLTSMESQVSPLKKIKEKYESLVASNRTEKEEFTARIAELTQAVKSKDKVHSKLDAQSKKIMADKLDLEEKFERLKKELEKANGERLVAEARRAQMEVEMRESKRRPQELESANRDLEKLLSDSEVKSTKLVERACKAEMQFLSMLCTKEMKPLEEVCHDAEYHIKTITNIVQQNPAMEVHVRETLHLWQDCLQTNRKVIQDSTAKFNEQIEMIKKGAVLDSMKPIEIPPPYKPEGLSQNGGARGMTNPASWLMGQRSTQQPEQAEAAVAVRPKSTSYTQPQTVAEAQRHAHALAQADARTQSQHHTQRHNENSRQSQAQMQSHLQTQLHSQVPPQMQTQLQSQLQGQAVASGRSQTPPSMHRGGAVSAGNGFVQQEAAQPNQRPLVSVTPVMQRGLMPSSGQHMSAQQPIMAPRPHQLSVQQQHQLLAARQQQQQQQQLQHQQQFQQQPQQPPQQPPPSKPKNSFERIMLRLSVLFPNYNKVQLTNFLKEVRGANNGSLSGLSVDEIMRRVNELVNQRQAEASGMASQRMVNKGALQTTLAGPPGFTLQPAPAPTQSAWGPVSSTSNWHKELVDGEAEEEDPCVICHDEMSSDTLELECGHIYHSRCIREWLKQQKTCPTCRKFTILRTDFPSL